MRLHLPLRRGAKGRHVRSSVRLGDTKGNFLFPPQHRCDYLVWCRFRVRVRVRVRVRFRVGIRDRFRFRVRVRVMVRVSVRVRVRVRVWVRT